MRHTRTMRMAQGTGSYFVKAAGLLVLAALLATALPAGATTPGEDGTIIWLPYLITQRNYGEWTGSWFGNSSSPVHWKFNDPNTSNVIWSQGRVWYDIVNSDSWYTFQGQGASYNPLYPTINKAYTSIMAWQLHLHNPNNESILVEATVYAGGSQANEATQYGSPNVTPDYLIDTTHAVSSPLQWDSTNDHFHVTVAANTTVTLYCWRADGGEEALFNDPDPAYQRIEPTIRLRQPDGYAFLATVEGDWRGYGRVATGTGTASFTSDCHPTGGAMREFRWQDMRRTRTPSYSRSSKNTGTTATQRMKCRRRSHW